MLKTGTLGTLFPSAPWNLLDKYSHHDDCTLSNPPVCFSASRQTEQEMIQYVRSNNVQKIKHVLEENGSKVLQKGLLLEAARFNALYSTRYLIGLELDVNEKNTKTRFLTDLGQGTFLTSYSRMNVVILKILLEEVL